MKKLNISIIFMAIISLLLIISCENSIQYGSLSVSVSGNENARTIQPATEDITFASYRIYGSHKTIEGETVDQKFTSQSIQIDGLAIGEWEFVAEGYNSEGVLLGTSEPKVVDIELNMITDTSYSLRWLKDGQGNLKLSIIVQSSRVETIECQITKVADGNVSQTLIVQNPTKTENLYLFEGSFTVDTGFYNSQIVMKDSEGNQIGVTLHPSIHILSGLTTSYEFSWENLADLIPVDSPNADQTTFYCTDATDNIVVLSTKEEDTSIYYSLDNKTYTEFDGSIDVTSSLRLANYCTIYTYATKNGLRQSETAMIMCHRKHNDVNYICQDCSLWTNGPAGGFVFYDCDADNTEEDPDGADNLMSEVCGWRFLEAAPSELGTSCFGLYQPDGTTDTIVGTSTELGTGMANTQNLVNALGDVLYAAKRCDNYSIEFNGILFDDWFLPSLDELLQINKNLVYKELGAFGKHNYWSSSEKSAQYAWFAYLGGGNFNGQGGDRGSSYSLYVLPIRAFK